MSFTRMAAAALMAAGLAFAGPSYAQTPATPPATEAPAETAPAATPLPAAPAPVEIAPPERTLPHDLSPWGMFMAADWVVKAVMIGLAIASVITWTIFFAKSVELFAARRRAVRGLGAILDARTLDEASGSLRQGRDVAATLVRAARHETRMSAENASHEGLKERVTSHLSRIEAGEARRMTRGTGMLATIGSTAPFVGLFGTVWGIMNSFIGISEAQTTNLAIVAPGIAEALLATAIGLVAAIPAVVIYNAFARSVAGYRLLLGDTSAAIERLVSRDMDARAGHSGRAFAAGE